MFTNIIIIIAVGGSIISAIPVIWRLITEFREEKKKRQKKNIQSLEQKLAELETLLKEQKSLQKEQESLQKEIDKISRELERLRNQNRAT